MRLKRKRGVDRQRKNGVKKGEGMEDEWREKAG
jgi:hypothetical protein